MKKVVGQNKIDPMVCTADVSPLYAYMQGISAFFARLPLYFCPRIRDTCPDISAIKMTS